MPRKRKPQKSYADIAPDATPPSPSLPPSPSDLRKLSYRRTLKSAKHGRVDSAFGSMDLRSFSLAAIPVPAARPRWFTRTQEILSQVLLRNVIVAVIFFLLVFNAFWLMTTYLLSVIRAVAECTPSMVFVPYTEIIFSTMTGNLWPHEVASIADTTVTYMTTVSLTTFVEATSAIQASSSLSTHRPDIPEVELQTSSLLEDEFSSITVITQTTRITVSPVPASATSSSKMETGVQTTAPEVVTHVHLTSTKTIRSTTAVTSPIAKESSSRTTFPIASASDSGNANTATSTAPIHDSAAIRSTTTITVHANVTSVKTMYTAPSRVPQSTSPSALMLTFSSLPATISMISMSSPHSASTQDISSTIDFGGNTVGSVDKISETPTVSHSSSTWMSATASAALDRTENSAVATPSSSNADVLATSVSSATTCGDQSNFVLNFDDLPAFRPTNKTAITQQPPVFNPYHHLSFSDGYVYAPRPAEPFVPTSPPNVGVFLASSIGLRASSGMQPGEIGDGTHGSASAYWFDAHVVFVGCDDGGPAGCTLVVRGYTWNVRANRETLSVQQNMTIPACEQFTECQLQPIQFPPTFRGLSGLQIQAYVGDQLQMFFIDDLALSWTNDTCAAGLERTSGR